VKRLLPFLNLGILDYAARLLVTLFAVFVLLQALLLVTKVHKLLLDSQNGLRNLPAMYVGKPAAATGGNSSVHPFWPNFPHSGAGNFQSAVINGVQTMKEQWQCNASSGEVLSYYRDQMTARGWQDATEKTYGGDPKMRELAAVENLPENQQVLNNYRDSLNSELVLKRDGWSLHISTVPAVGPGEITVKLFAAATPSIENFFMGMSSGVVANKEGDGRPLDVKQENGSEHYHTTIAAKSETPAQAFQTALTKYSALGWRPVMMLPKERTPSGYFAWLVRGKQYAALSVNTSPHGQGASVTFTEVTPDH
jgi:hypothetical protein